MSSMPTPDARAVVRVLDALLTQVKRIADHTASGSFALAPPPVVDTDDAPTAPVVGHAVIGIAAAPCTCAGTGFGDGTCALHGSDTPCIDARPAPSADEQAYRWARREPLLDLLTRLQRGRTPTADEARTLRQLVETEMSEADTARAELTRSENARDHLRRRAETAEKELERADAVTGETKRLMDRRTKTLHERAQTAETELFVLRCGLRANGADPTQIQNLWAQIRLRNRQWRDTKQELRLTRNQLENEEIDTDLIDEMVETVASAHDKLQEAQAEAEQLRALLATETARANAAIDRETTAEEAAEEQRATIERTVQQMQIYKAAGSSGVNPSQVINLLSLTRADGNDEAPAPSTTEGN
ncbi:hypothetical protein ACFWFU_07025 [Streptomyces sp. NPDC060235]|uniref:hypothetical protein n=1 Tax=Streptomyces sp. NPDC060235 TaxID=3347080 RepID=UPI00365954BB